jgi:membrane-bound lytic murein transglycosylase D
MTPKYLLSISVLGWFCLYFTTPIHANQSFEQTLQDLPQQVLNVTDFSFLEDNHDVQVQAFIDLYAHNWGHYTEKLFGKASYYFPIFSQHLAAADLPDALKFMPLIESHLVPDAESPRSAKGLWQFMPTTARYYGLRVDAQVDERVNPHLASVAAAKMLSELFETFGDWKLVLAAYNCGPWRVKRSMAKAKSNQYEDIARYLPPQTQQYLKKFTAMLYLGRHFSDFGLVPKVNTEDIAAHWQTVPFSQGHDLDYIARLIDLDISLLRQLNPQWMGAKSNFQLLLPDYAAQQLDTLSREIHGRSLEDLAQKVPDIEIGALLFCGDQEENASNDHPLLPGDKTPTHQWQELMMSWIVLPRFSLFS